MFSSWFTQSRRTVLSWTASIAVLVLMVIAAVVSTGYQAQRLKLDDGAVWVTNDDKQAVGRANTKIFELNTVLTTESAQMDLIQDSSHVFIMNDATRSLDVIDQASGVVSESIPLPQDVTFAALTAENVILHAPASGDVWVVPVANVSGFDAQTQPANFNVGAESSVAVSPDGQLAAVSAATSQVATLDIRNSVSPELTQLDADLTDRSLAITLVDTRWVVLDYDAQQLRTAGRMIDLSGEIDNLDQAQLQNPSLANKLGSNQVLLAFNGGLVAVDLGSGQVQSLSNSLRGRPAAPIFAGDCAYAAWSSGSVWSQCAGEDSRVDEAEDMSGSATLVFRHSEGSLALNDTATGTVWAVQDGVRLIDNWDALLEQQAQEQQVIQTNNAQAPEYEKSPAPPVAVDDVLGARPARVTSLPVLLNDYDPNGDALAIDSVTDISASLGEVFISAERNSVMLRLDPAATGVVDFDYTISDGRGGEASAHVQVTIRPESENSAPVQVRPTRSDVAVGRQVILNVLGDWVDPDGDSIFVAQAQTDAPDTLSFTPAGRIAFSEAGRGGGGARQISLEVSDGRASGFGSAEVTVHAAGQVPITAEPFAVLAIAGEPITINPSNYVRGGSGVLALTGVPSVPGLDIVTDFADFSFSVTASRTGSTYIGYAVSDGDATGSGLVRLDVIDPPELAARPITAAHSVFVPLQQSRDVDITATDRDPAGGILVVTGVGNIPVDSGIQAEIIDHHIVRVTVSKPLATPVAFTYRISNGISQSEGTITVVQTPAPTVAQAPVAVADVVSVRVGDVISIPVLANDIHPDGGELTLDPALDQNVPASAGLLFASGSTLRFLAGDQPGTYSAIYRVNADNGQWSNGTVTISVRAIDEQNNQAPAPQALTARVMSGQTVRIPIPVVGIDPDGDSVQFVGLDTNPEKGAISAVGGDWIEYEASAYATGTDTFSYSVIDALGAQASATIRVGIAEALEGARNPVAVADSVLARPGYTVYVRVLDNDSDPDGRPLTVTKVTSQDDALVAEVVDDIVKITVPNATGRYGLVYEIENDLAGTASNFITVDVATSAPLSRPVLADSVVSLTDILGNSSVDVNVMKNAFFADGPISSLRPSIPRGYGSTAQVISSNTVRVEVTAQSQIIPFQVAHPDDASVVSYAFIWVPGTDDALPQRKRGVKPLTVESEQTLRIDINEYVIAALGKTVKLTDSALVKATHADGSKLAVNDTTLTYTSEERYFGPASISFEVTDGASASADGAHTAVIVLPITVTPRENMPPVMLGASIDLEPGQEKSLDLTRVTRYPYADDQDELEYSVSGASQGISADLSGQTLNLRASDDAVKGKVIPLAVTVRDEVNEGSSGQILVRIVPSTRPLAIPATDSITIQRGQTQTVDVLANDGATNPYPGQPLRVISVRGLNSANIPSGVSVTPSSDKSTLTVSVSANADPSDTTLEYEVADATNDPDRFTWGVINISVQDVPDPASAPERATSFVSGSLTLQWQAPAANNSPITKYTVESDGGYRKDCSATVCTLDGLPTGQRFKFSVTATNALGTSAPSPWSPLLSADVIPAGPNSVTVTTASYDGAHPDGGGINVSWSAVYAPAGASAVNKYIVEIFDSGSLISTFDIPAGTTSLPTLWLSPGHSYSAKVSARNDADTDSWNATESNTVTAIGKPQVAGISATQTGNAGETTVSWNAVGANGASSVTYYLKGSSSAYSGEGCPSGYNQNTLYPVTGLSFADNSAKPAGFYNYVLYADNGFSCVAQIVSLTIEQRIPGAATYVSAACLYTDAQLGEQACTSALPAGTAFTIKIGEPSVASLGSAVTSWQVKVGASQWMALTQVPGATPTAYQIESTQYFASGGAAGASQTVQVRGCTTDGLCGAEGGSTQVDIPPRAP